MNLIDKIRADRITAFKAKENIRKNLLGCLIADSCKETKEPSDEAVLKIVKKFIENAQFVVAQTKEGEYDSYQASMEIDILEAYRPSQMTLDEVNTVIAYQDEVMKESVGERISLPFMMKYFKEHHAGRYDGKMVSEAVKVFLK